MAKDTGDLTRIVDIVESSVDALTTFRSQKAKHLAGWWMAANGCPYRELDPNVLVVQSTEMRPRKNPSEAMDFARNGCVLVQRQMCARLVVVCHVR